MIMLAAFSSLPLSPVAFGIRTHAECPKCRGEMKVMRRGPEFRAQHRRQVLACCDCGHEAARVVNGRGEPVH